MPRYTVCIRQCCWPLAIVAIVACVLVPQRSMASEPEDNRGLRWHDDLDEALRLAQSSGRPLFVTFRCLPCKQCSDFDRDVLDGGPLLDPLLDQFVTVRLTDASKLDMRYFPVEGYQDTDLSWWGYFLSDTGALYGIFGGRDVVSESTRISEAALCSTLQRVLDHHNDPSRRAAPTSGPDLSKPRVTPPDLPGFASWSDKTHRSEKSSCIRCHQVGEILRQPALDAKTFDKHGDLDIWPLPENVGITLDRDDGLMVSSVEPGSPAAKAGLLAGDSLKSASGQPFFGQADFRGVLHRGPRGTGSIPVEWRRGSKTISGTLDVADGWRATPLDWRMSVASGNIGVRPGFFPLLVNDEKRKALGLAPDAMAVTPFMGKEPAQSPFAEQGAYKAGLRPQHIITAVDGESPNLWGRSFLVWFRLRHNPGDRATFTVTKPDGKTRTITALLD